MTESLDRAARAALLASLREKVARLVAEQETLSEQRAELLARQRRNDRDLADCRATARLFDLEIAIPLPEREAMTARDREMFEMEQRRRSEMDLERRLRAQAEEVVRAAAKAREEAASHLKELVERRTVTAETQAGVTGPQVRALAKRPTLKAFLLERLRTSGAEGAKAASLREAFERAFGETIHEKTVGMTLYRMSKDNLVRRDGHTWFIAEPASAIAPQASAG